MEVSMGVNEAARLNTLHKYNILDTAPERAFDDINRLAAHICGTPIALISLIDDTRQWFKSQIGLTASEITQDASFCTYTLQRAELVVIQDTLADKQFATKPWVTSDANIRFYAGMPLITLEGYALGTLCVMDCVPRKLNREQEEALRALSYQVITQLELRRKLFERQRMEEALHQAHAELELRVEERTAELRHVNEQLQSEIVEHQQLEIQLRRREQELADFFDNGVIGLHRVGPDGTVLWANQAELDLLGYSREEYIGHHIANFHADQVVIEDILRRLTAQEILKDYEARLLCKDGTIRYVLIDSNVFWEDGQFIHTRCFTRDITERKRAEELLLERSRLATLEADVRVSLTRSNTLQDILQQCTEALVRHLDAAFARIWTLNSSENVLELQASAGLYSHIDGAHSRIPMGQFKIGMIAQSRQPHFTNSVIGDPLIHDQAWAVREGMVAFAGYPLVVEERLVGVMAIFASQPLPEATLEVMASVANGIGLGIQRKQAEEALCTSKNHLRAIIEAEPECIKLLAPNGTLLDMNAAGLAMIEVDSPEAAIGLSAFSLIAPEHREAFQQFHESICQGNKGILEFEIIGSKGTRRWMESHAVPLPIEVDGMLHLAITRDITNRKRAEEKLAFQAHLLDVVGQAVIATDLEGAIIYWNRFAEELYGWSADEVLGRSIVEVAPARAWEDHVLTNMKQLQAGKSWSGEFLVQRRDGSTFPVFVTDSPVHNDQGVMIGIVGVSKDISDLKRTEAALRQSEERFRSLSACSPVGIFMADIKGRCMYTNPRWEAISGFTFAEALGEGWAQSVHPEDRERVFTNWSVHVRRGWEYADEFRLQTKAGTVCWIHVRSSPMFADTGELIGHVGTTEDITERKQAAEALRKAHAELEIRVIERTAELSNANQQLQLEIAERQRAEEVLCQSEERFRSLSACSPVGIFMTDSKGHCTYTNPRCQAICDFTFEEALGEGYMQAIHPDDHEWVLADWLRCVATGQEHSVEYRFQTKAGDIHWVHARSAPMFADTGELIGHVGTTEDITERKQAAEALRKAHAELEIRVMERTAELSNANQQLQLEIAERQRAEEVLCQSEQRFRNIFDHSNDAIFVVDPACDEILDVNPKGCDMLEYPHEELLFTPMSAIHPHEMPKLQAFAQLVSQNGQGWTDELTCRTKSGQFIPAEISASTIDVAGITYLLALVRDIRERRKAEEALQQARDQLEVRVQERTRELAKANEALQKEIIGRKLIEKELLHSNERFQLAASAVNCVIYDWDIQRNTVERTAAGLINVLGYSPQEAHPTSNWWKSRIHPDDRQHICQQVWSALINGSDFAVEYRIRHRSNQYRHVWDKGIIVRNSDGQAIRVVGSFLDISDRKQAEEQLLHDALHDQLTGLPNRALFMDRLAWMLKYAKRHADYLFAVLFLDLDRFKIVNDSLGHIIGDQLLVAIANRLQVCLRPSDRVARLGGDEFTILLSGIKDMRDVACVADRIHKQLTAPFNLNGHEVFTTASIGIALSTTGYDQPEELLRDADIAMYRAKALGKARYEVFDKDMHTSAVARLQLEMDLRRAIERQEFQLYYQPIVSLETSRITGFEALLRWQHPSRGLISPVEFISVTEETGLIIPIGQWVLREACSQMHEWRRQLPILPLTINVNLSGKQFTQPDLIKQIKQVLQETDLEACNLGLEITESVIMENTEAVSSTLFELRALGIQLHVDDFGTGYSSLSYLHRFPIDVLKIDRTFISRISVGAENLEIVQTIIVLARSLGMKVTAEGVETKEQLAQLRMLECEYGQGYFFSKPINSKMAETLIAEGLKWQGQ